MSEMTQTGIPIGDCAQCGRRHPLTRNHCPVCGLATLFGHFNCEVNDGEEAS